MKKTFLLLALSFVVLSLNAKERTTAEMKNAATKVLNKSSRVNAAPRQGELVELHKMSGLTIFGYADCGFAVIANDDLLPEVLGVSDSSFSGTDNPSFAWWLKAINQVCEMTVARGGAYANNVPTPEELGFEPNVDAIVSAEWDQDTPYWNMCPKKNGSTALTGCVATAIAQVLYTHKTPIAGSGSRTNNSWSPVTFDYEGYTPDYDSMIDQYTSGPNANQYTNDQVEPMAKLMLACGVAVNMEYSPNGSGAYTDQAAAGLIQYMGISTADFQERDNFSDEEWMTMVYEELAGGHAMYYSAVDYSGWQAAGHAFVCDGYDEQGRVHINWGWSGKDNGFFNINLLNPAGYTFSYYQDFIRGLWDPNESTEGIEFVDLTLEDVAAGSLAELITAENYVALRSLTVSGELNNDDMALLKTLASGVELTEFELEGTGHLSKLDLSDAVLADDEISNDAFKDCAKLTSIKLPRQLSRIGNNAFNGCTRLNNITSYTYNVPKMGTRVFEGTKTGAMKVNVIAGSSEYYRRNAQWKVIIRENNVYEFGTCLKAKNYTREYGENNPVFGYQMVGDRVTGSPRLWTEANADSAPGKYAINIEAGSIVDTKNVVFVPGTLTIKGSAVNAIEDVRLNESVESYNLNGVRINGNSYKGIRIENGKKVIR